MYDLVSKRLETIEDLIEEKRKKLNKNSIPQSETRNPFKFWNFKRYFFQKI